MANTIKPTATGRQAIAAIRRRLEKLELEHLRSHAAELADKVDRLQVDLYYAEQAAVSWRDDCLRMMEESLQPGGAIGLAKDGSLHVMQPVALTGTVTPESVDKVRQALTKAGAA